MTADCCANMNEVLPRASQDEKWMTVSQGKTTGGMLVTEMVVP